MNIVALVFLILFAASSIFQLVVCFLEKEELRKLSKVPCMILLSLAAIFAAPNAPLVYFGAFFAAIGDYFLIFNKEPKQMTIGQIFFALSHVCYVSQIFIIRAVLPWFAYLIFFAVIIAGGFIAIPLTKKMVGKEGAFGNFYLFLLICTFVASLALAIATKNPYAIGLAVSYLVFISSDGMVVIATYIKDFKRRDFPIMLTYLAASFGIVYCLIGLLN